MKKMYGEPEMEIIYIIENNVLTVSGDKENPGSLPGIDYDELS